MKLVLLSTWGSPVSGEYLKQLLLLKSRGLEITAAYEENAKVAADISRIYKERFGEETPLFQSSLSLGVPSLTFSNFKEETSLKQLEALKPDLFVLAGTSIVKSPLLGIPKIGTLNCHPGILPRYRGCTCLEWAIAEDEPVGATCHFVTEEIDAGDILLKEVMPVHPGDTYRGVRLRMFYFQAQVLAKAIKNVFDEGIQSFHKEAFDWNLARYYKPIPEDLFKLVCEKIEKGTYPHLTPVP